MPANGKKRSLIVIQLIGANDPLNTVIPYNNGLYYDYRPNVNIPANDVLPIDDDFGFSPQLGPIKDLWDRGNVALVNGIGYTTPVRSHFRSMDIWHTCEPDKIATEGWLGRAIRDMDPQGDNVLTGINFGRGLPRALGCKGVPVASVGNLDTYGLFPDLEDEQQKGYALEAFARMYGMSKDNDPIMDSLSQTGRNALKGADILRTAPGKYSSSVEYAQNPISQNMKSIAQVMFADLGTRVFYTSHGSFDTHGGELVTHVKLWEDLAGAIADCYADLEEHGMQDDTMMLVWTELGRRIRDNGSGTDHGAGGTAMLIGGSVKGGMYGEYPSLEEAQQLDGDLRANNDFRSTYSTILERWLELDAPSIVNGQFEHMDFIAK